MLTRFQPQDAEEIFYTYASKPECTRFMAWPTHESIKDTRAYLTRTARGWRQGLDFSFSIRLKTTYRLIGACGFLNDGGRTQVGYILGSLFWNQGYATEAAGRLVELLRQVPEVVSIGTFVDAENRASIRVLEKIGLEAEAVAEFVFPNQGNKPRACVIFKWKK